MLKFAGHSKTFEHVEEVIRTLSNYPLSVSHGVAAAKLIEIFILANDEKSSEEIIKNLKNEIRDQLPDVVQSIDSVNQQIKVEHVIAVGKVFGRPCYNPGSFQVGLYNLVIQYFD